MSGGDVISNEPVMTTGRFHGPLLLMGMHKPFFLVIKRVGPCNAVIIVNKGLMSRHHRHPEEVARSAQNGNHHYPDQPQNGVAYVMMLFNSLFFQNS